MHRWMIILSFGLLSQVLIFPQAVKSQDFVSVDAKTYRLYLEKQWDELIPAGREGLKNDIDYYYLRMRIGIAYYEKRNYKASQAHFRKALEFNEGDPAALEYLYYAYLLAGQFPQAGLLAKKFTPSLAEKINPAQPKFAERLSVEYLYNFNDTEQILSDPESYFSGLPYGYQLLTLDFSNLSAMLYHGISPGITLTHAYTRLSKSNYYYYNDGLYRFGADGQKVVQHQYYISPAFSTRGGLNFSPFFHYLRVKSQAPYVVTGSSGPGFGGGTSSYLRYKDLFTSDFVGGMNLSRHAGRFTIRLAGIYSFINDASQLTGTAGLTWYPIGNLDLYLHGDLNSLIEFKDKGTSLSLIPDFLIGFGISSRVWMEFSGAYGNMENFTEDNGYIVYNSLDWMKYKVMGSIVIPVTKQGSRIYLGGRFAEYESRFIPFDPLGEMDRNSIITNGISIYGGLSWKF